MKNILLLLCFLLGFLAPLSIEAQNCPGANRVVSNCKASTPNDAIGIAMKKFFQDGGSATWRFESGATFIENTDGTARLKGVIAYYDKPTRRFDIDITFIGQTYTPPMGSPVLMNTSPSTVGWYYYDWGTATLTGLGDLAGAKLNLSKRGKAFQVGIGAADQVVDAGKFGATGWFSWSVVSQPTNPAIRINAFPANPDIDQADICIGLSGTPTTCGNVQNCPGADRVVSNCKASTPNDAIGIAMKNFFQDGGSATWRFEPGATFVENTDGTARLKGVIAYYDKPNRRFDIDITFIGRTFIPPAGSPVLINTSPSTVGWYYYDWGTATLTGLGDLAGAKLNLFKRGKSFQVGVGAADQVVDAGKFGASGWFSWSIVSQPTNAAIRINTFPANPDLDQADICIGLSGTPTTCGNPCETDNKPPVFSGCPANITVTTLFVEDNCAVVTWTPPTATDSCSTPTVTLSTSPTAGLDRGACFAIGVTTITYKATDAKGNMAFCTFTITVIKRDPCINANLKAVASSISTTCGANNGTAVVIVSGGTGPYTYAWSNGATTSSISNLAAGNYTVIVTDKNGCTATATTTVGASTNIVVNVSSTNAACGVNNGTATASVSGGTAPYTYAWSNGATTASISGLGAGTYTVIVTDSKGCSSTKSVTVTSTSGLSVSISKTNVKCNGDSNGSATATVTGGTAPITYLWSNGAITSSISGLAAGIYSVTATDKNGCSASASTVIAQPAKLTLAISSTSTSCGGNNGSVSVVVSGGTAPYSYAWSNGGTTASISNLAAGNYTVVVTDVNGCTATATTTVGASTNIVVNVSSTNAACGANNGTAAASVNGGTAPFTYSWSTGATTASISGLGAGTYTVSVTDKNGCSSSASVVITASPSITISISKINAFCNGNNTGSATATVTGGTAPITYLWSNGVTTATISNLFAGTYSVTATDKNGCTASASTIIAQPSALNLVTSSSPTSCGGSNGSASVAVSGATAPYSYAWSNGRTTASIPNLAAGNYTVVVKDANGCTATATVSVAASTSLSVSITGVNSSCGANNGSATASVIGGTAPFTYLWSTGATTASISGLGAGTYSVSVTDKNGCTGSASVIITASPRVTVTVSKTNVKCNGESSGTATATVAGGTAPFTYLWSNGGTTATISNLIAGIYSVTVTDKNSCTATGQVIVAQPAKLTLSLSSTPATCLPIGSATVAVTGGTPPYTYLWSNGATTATISNLAGGNYNVTVTDANGCKATGSVTVTANNSPNLTCSVTITRLISAINANDGEVKVTATGGAAPYTYLWSNGKTTSVISFLSPGTYSVTVTDNNGCKTICSANLPNSTCDALVDAGRISGDEDFCPGGTLSPILETVQPSGGSGVLEYLWMYSTNTSVFDANTWIIIAGETGPNLINVPALTRTAYFIRCVRRKGCDTYKETNVVTKRIKAFAEIKGPFSACVGQNVTFTATDLGPTANYVWYFDNANIYTSTSRTITVKFTTVGSQRASLEVYNLGCMRMASQTVTVTSCLVGSGIIQSFNLSVVNTKNIKLDWATVNENVPSKYVVERSNDGKVFKEMSDFSSQNKSVNIYRFDDNDPKMGRAYYRIKHIEADGKISYSEIKKSILYINGGDPIMVYPNPVGNQLFVELLDVENTEGVIEVYNALGSLMVTKNFTKEQTRYEVNTAKLPVGNYILKIRQSNGEIKTIKVNKF